MLHHFTVLSQIAFATRSTGIATDSHQLRIGKPIHYLAQAAYPPAAEALIGAVSRATELQLPLGTLPEASREAHVDDDPDDDAPRPYPDPVG